MTSLAQQLKKLVTPQTSAVKEQKKKASLLFDPKEAASLDRETFYEIGSSGFSELKNINPAFGVFENTLFSLSSKDFERSVQTKDANKRLDESIRRFLLRLSPYFLIRPAHKALEWLIHRFQIHQYNKDDIFALILPYHETKMFVRFVQIMKLQDSRWDWLEPIQKPGIPLAKIVLHNRCGSEVSLLGFVFEMVKNTVEEFGERAEMLTTLFAFYCSTTVGAIENANKMSEPMITSILPGLLHCLSSPFSDLCAAGYIITSQIILKTQLKEKLVRHLVYKILTDNIEITTEAILVLQLIYKSQPSLKYVPKKALANLTPNVMTGFCSNMKTLIENNVYISDLYLVFVKSYVKLIQSDIESFRMFSEIPEMLVTNVDVDPTTAEKLTKSVIKNYSLKESDQPTNTDETVEIFNLDSDDDTVCTIQSWYSQFVKMIQQKYPSEFDRVLKNEIKNGDNSTKISSLSKVLGFGPRVMKKLGNAYLFEMLYHPNEDIRVEAVSYLIDNYKEIIERDENLLRDSILDRLNDDSPEVVVAVLDLPFGRFGELFERDVLLGRLRKIIVKGHTDGKWLKASSAAISILCAFSTDNLDTCTYIAPLPYLFPTTKEEIPITEMILKSSFGAQIISATNRFAMDDCDYICEKIFLAIKTASDLPKTDKLIEALPSIDNDCYLSALLVIILLSVSIKEKVSSDDSTKMMNVLIDFTRKFKFSEFDNSVVLNEKSVAEFIKKSKSRKLPVEALTYFFEKLIKYTDFKKDSSNHWIDFTSKTNDEEFIISGVDLLLSGHFMKFESFSASFLKSLVGAKYKKVEDKIEFFANFLIAQIVIGNNDTDVEVNVLLIRSVMVLQRLIGAYENVEWIYDSKVTIVALLFCLGSSDDFVRASAIEMINTILNKDESSSFWKVFLKELEAHQDELKIDEKQLPLIVNKILFSKTGDDAISMKHSLDSLIIIILGKSPFYVKNMLLSFIPNVKSSKILVSLSILAMDILNDLKDNKRSDMYKMQTFTSILSHVSKFITQTEKKELWNLAEEVLKNYNISYTDRDGKVHYISVFMMQQIDQEFFGRLSPDKAQTILNLIINAGTFGENPLIITAAAKSIKRIELKANIFLPILNELANVFTQNNEKVKKKKDTASMFSILESKEWKMGITLLEHIQDKKRLYDLQEALLSLFTILKKCLEFDDHSVVEYAKQLLLTTILHCCTKLYPIDNLPKKPPKNDIDIELIILCIRGTQNPQTHHHALMLLSHVALILPNQVLQHMMAIFTFIGSSVLRQDDDYSFQIITKIIETIIPILVKSSETDAARDIKKLEKHVVPVLRVFVDAVLDIPEHRRFPLFKKLLLTLDSNNFLWCFLGLLFEAHVIHGSSDKNEANEPNVKSTNKDQPVRRLDFALSMMLDFLPNVTLNACNQLIVHLKSLPEEKPESTQNIDLTAVFSVAGHTAKHLRHYKYTIVTFINSLLSSPQFISSINSLDDKSIMEQHYKNFIINILLYIQNVSKAAENNVGKPQNKYWKVMLHHCYEILDNANNLLPVEMFVIVLRGLTTHNLATVKRKAMEILNTKLQHQNTFFASCSKDLMFTLLDPLLDVVRDIENSSDKIPEGTNKQETELNQQTALLSLKLLTRMLCQHDRDRFKTILGYITDLMKTKFQEENKGNLLASIVLFLAELCSNLKAHAISALPKYMPALIKILKDQTKADTPELVLLSVITAIHKIVETIPLFLSPYLEKILYQLSIISGKWKGSENKNSPISNKLSQINGKISSTITLRVLIPVISHCYNDLITKQKFDAVGPLMSILAESFTGVSGSEFASLQQDLTSFFLSALQFRSDHVNKTNVTHSQIDDIEENVIKALGALILKLSESSFRPLYYKIYDWSIRETGENYKHRAITFYKLSSHIAENLRGLFVLFAGHFIKNAADLLNACNKCKVERLFLDDESECCLLVEYILKTLNYIFTYDTQNFVNKDRFDTVMQPVVDQLENCICDVESLKKRSRELIIPCIAQFAIATADDSLWKPLNYQILLKTRHNDPDIRLLGLECMSEMATKLGESWLPLLPESIPFLAELLEDDEQTIEAATQKTIQTLETVLGEPLQKYF